MHRIFLFLTLAPILFWIGCIAVVLLLGGPFGCTIHEGFANDCMVLGLNLGDFAYAAGFWGAWGLLILMPISLGFAALWAILTVVLLIQRRLRR